jgi:hypothetical protein
MSRWNDEERPSMFARLRSLPTAVQVTGVLTAGVVVIDLLDRVKDILLPIIMLITRRIGSCP